MAAERSIAADRTLSLKKSSGQGMKRLPVLDEDRRSIAAWFENWARLVAAVDFKRVREMFAEDAIAFGSKVEMMTSREALEREQWRAVWPTMEDYRYDIDTLKIVISPDR